MAREKENYRTMLSFLTDTMKCPLTMTKIQTASFLGIARGTLDSMIKDGVIKANGNKITVGALANYLCG